MESLHFSKEDYNKIGVDGIVGEDKYGTFRATDVEYQPLEYVATYDVVSNPDEIANLL